MKLTLCSVAVLMAALTVTSVAAADLTLVQNGQPASTIVIAKEATRAAQLGAYELQYHFQLITGATVPIVTDDQTVTGTRLLVGASAQTQALGLSGAGFKSQEYTVKFLPGVVAMLGSDKDDRGQVDYSASNCNRCATWPNIYDQCATLYAVYDVLEQYCGVRWFNPTELGIVYPHRRTLAISGGKDERRTPVFYDRATSIIPPEIWLEYTSLWRPDEPQFAEVEQMAWPELRQRFPDKGQYALAKRSEVTLHMFRARLGGDRLAANHSFYGYAARFWEKSADPEAAKLWEGAHPEYFATGYENVPPQMNYSNPGFIDQVARDAHEYFANGKSYPGSQNSSGKYFAAMPMDNGWWSKDPVSQAALRPERDAPGFNGQASDYIYGFLNQVARQVAKTDPGKFLTVCAYSDYTWHPSFALEPNIAVDMCFSTRNWFAPACEASDRKIMAEWAPERGKRPLHCWVYWTFPKEIAVNGKFHAFPGAFAHTAARQFRWLRDNGVLGIFYCGYMDSAVEDYVASKMMDDPNRDVDQLLDEFFTMQFGAAGKPLREFYEAIENTFMNPKNYPPEIASGKVGAHLSRSLTYENLATPERMAQFAAIIARADAAPVTSAQRVRVAWFRKQIWEYMVEGRRIYDEQRKIPVARVTVPRIAPLGGDATKVDWSQAAPLDNWRLMTGAPALFKLSGNIAHDGQYLYVRLVHDDVDVKTLVVDSFPWRDCWELFAARKPELPYRQLGIGPTGQHQDYTHGEAGIAGTEYGNWDSGVKIVSDTTSDANRWVTYAAFPLDKLVMRGGVKAGDKFYMNFERTRFVPQLTIHGWSPSFAGTMKPTRLGEVTLAK